MEDLYARRPEAVREPPETFWGRLRYLGPSLIVTANVVGSGELIMTTTLGARAGFVALWVILVSCFFKVAVQLEFGKHAIDAGSTSLRAFQNLPGPRLGNVRWSVWVWLAAKSAQAIQYGGILGGVALALHIAVPAIAVWQWAALTGLVTALLVAGGQYRWIERISIALIAAFSLFTILCVVVLAWTPYRFSLNELLSGLRFDLPPEAIGVAVAAFAITGVSADEITTYPYWCLEKGYARFTGPNDGSAEWVRRARGWIRVMYLDAFVSMLIYTVTTAAFYVLGAAILNRRGEVPQGYETLRTLSRLYTESVGPWAMVVFLAGAIVVLYSTVFVACASATRTFTDAFTQIGWADFQDPARRARWIRSLAWILPALWTGLFLAAREPVAMIMVGGIAMACLLGVIVFSALVFRYRRLSPALRPSPVYDLLLWASCLAIAGVGTRAVSSAVFGD